MNDKNTDNTDYIIQTCKEIIEENKEVFTTEPDKILAAMEIALHCYDLARRKGLLEMEEYVDNRCGRKQEEVPLWEYLKPACWIMVQVMVDAESRIWMLSSLFASYQYIGCQAVQGCIYLLCMVFLVSTTKSTEALFEQFRTWVPQEKRAAFDSCFKQIS